MDHVCYKGHFGILTFLKSHRNEECTGSAFGIAEFTGRVSVVRWLLRNFPDNIEIQQQPIRWAR